MGTAVFARSQHNTQQAKKQPKHPRMAMSYITSSSLQLVRIVRERRITTFDNVPLNRDASSPDLQKPHADIHSPAPVNCSSHPDLCQPQFLLSAAKLLHAIQTGLFLSFSSIGERGCIKERALLFHSKRMYHFLLAVSV